jgi:hypothetical protein
MVGAMKIAPNGWCEAWGLRQMAANGLSTRKQQSNGNLGITPANWKNCGAAIVRSRRPKEKLRHGNQRIALAKRKIAARPSGYHAGLFKKIAVRQSGYRAGLFKNHGAAIGVSCRPLQKSRRGNRSIAPASWKIAARHRAGLLKNCGAASRQPLEKSRRGIAPDHAGLLKNRGAASRRPFEKLRRGITPASW